MSEISFRRCQRADLELLYNWFQTPEIHQWYARGKNWSFSDIENKYLPRILGEEPIPSFMIEYKQQAIGFIQYYPLSYSLPNSLTIAQTVQYQIDLKKTAGIDLFIAETAFLGKGWGPKIITQFLESIVFKKYDLIFIDPDKINTRAIKAYAKCGFQAMTDHESEQTCLMVLSKESLNNPSPFFMTIFRRGK